MTKTCGFTKNSISEWQCHKKATHMVIYVTGSGYVEWALPRCTDHVLPTIADLNPPGSPYPYDEFRRVEFITPDTKWPEHYSDFDGRRTFGTQVRRFIEAEQFRVGTYPKDHLDDPVVSVEHLKAILKNIEQGKDWDTE
jgi:hypothetical protein